ncbi:unnamed protein product [Closterium sp. Naga37s-1]|nr:unnamed protein product [Closterium sp. Naga37s-1]
MVSERVRSTSPYRPYHSPAPSHSSRLPLLPFLTVARPFPPKARPAVPPLPPSRRARIALPQPRALSTVQQRARLPFLVARPALPQSAPSLTLLLLPSLLCASPHYLTSSSSYFLSICCGSQLLVARPALPTIRPFTLLLLSSLPLVPSPLSHPSSTSFLSSSAAAGS